VTNVSNVELTRRLRELRERGDGKLLTAIAALTSAVEAVNAKTRRGGGILSFLVLGAQNLDITWSTPFPDDQYGVWIQTSSASPAQVHAVPVPATKTAEGIRVTVVAALAVGDVVVDVIAERSA